MIGKTVLLMCFIGVQVNFVLTNTVPPSQIEPMPDVYSLVTTYPATNNVVNYNASPNPQYASPNFNNFNEQMVQPPLHMSGNYRKREYQDYQQKPVQQQKSTDEMVMGTNPTTASYDYSSSDLKTTLASVNDNLGLMANTQRILLNSFKVQQQQYNDIAQKLNDTPFPRNSAYNGQPNYGPTATQQPSYQYPPQPLPPLPYGQSTEKEQIHHNKKQSAKKLLKKIFAKHKKGNNRGLALLQRRSESDRLQRHAAMTLSYIRNGIVSALWTAALVACVKLTPILLFGIRLMFQSVLPLTGLALFGSNRGLFPLKTLKKDDDLDLQLDDIDEDEDLDEIEDDDRDVTEEKEESGHHYR